MALREIVPGIFHWTALHEPIRAPVSSYYVQPAGVVLDPKVPDEGLDALPGRPQQVVLSSGHHLRDGQRFAEAFDIPIRASSAAAAHIGDAAAIEPFDDGDEVAPGVTAIDVGALSEAEGALHVAVGEGAIAFGDALNRYGEALSFLPDGLLGDDPQRVKEALRQALKGLLTRDFDHLLFAHGDPLVGGGKSALRDFIASPVGEEDFGQSL
jgi:hypothetical protein